MQNYTEKTLEFRKWNIIGIKYNWNCIYSKKYVPQSISIGKIINLEILITFHANVLKVMKKQILVMLIVSRRWPNFPFFFIMLIVLIRSGRRVYLKTTIFTCRLKKENRNHLYRIKTPKKRRCHMKEIRPFLIRFSTASIFITENCDNGRKSKADVLDVNNAVSNWLHITYQLLLS